MPFVLFQATPLWREVFWVSYAAWGLSELWIWSRDRRAASGQRRDRGSFYAVVGSIWVGITLAFFAPYIAPWADIGLPPAPLFWSAIALIWTGVALRLWAVLTLGVFFRLTVRIHDEHRLVTSGPYRLLRHPSYTGALLTAAGIGLAMGNWLAILSAVLFMLAGFAVRIVVEETALAAAFGADFDAHRKRTWAVIPLVW